MTPEEMQELHNELWAFRDEMDATTPWKTPSPLDSLRYAFTEVAEALSDWLRVNRDHARNHDHEPDVLAELADCAMMLMTALGKGWKYDSRGYIDGDSTLEGIADIVAAGLFTLFMRPNDCDRVERTDAQLYTMDALWLIADYPGMDLPTELRKRMARIRGKHGRGDHDQAS